jgi:RNA polymerase-binding transcription factor DksA
VDLGSVSASLEAATCEARIRLGALRSDLAAIIDAADTATDDEHDPEGTTAFERAQVQTLIDSTVEQLHELDAAQRRLGSGTYGFCEGCATAIDPERLAARPSARTCITCARRR